MKKCFSCRKLVEDTVKRCPECGTASFILKSETGSGLDVAKSDIPDIRGEDGWKEDDAFIGNEKTLQRVCHNRLTSLGVKYIIHLRSQTKAMKGMPDLVFKHVGHDFGIELKQKSGRIDDDQRYALTKMLQDGWNVCVCYSLKQMDDFINETTKDSK